MSEALTLFGEPLIQRAAFAGVAIALLAGPLGCFAVWRRMAYLGDATAHAALLGVALGLIAGLPIWLGAFAVGLSVAGGAGLMSRRGKVGPDAALGALSHSALGIALVMVSLAGVQGQDLEAYLFTGDPLAARPSDLIVYGAVVSFGLGLIAYFWRTLLNATLSPELAAAEGGSPRIAQIALMLALAIYVALAMRLVGLLLATALLILPAVVARPFASRPETMAIGAALIGALGSIVGLIGSLAADTPTGPSMVTALFVFLLISFGVSAVLKRQRPEPRPADGG